MGVQHLTRRSKDESLLALARELERLRQPVSLATLSRIVEHRELRAHLAILTGPYLDLIISGRKTIESRFLVNRVQPIGSVMPGDVLILKDASGPIRGAALVKDAKYFGPLHQGDVEALFDEYATQLCIDQTFRERKKNSRFAALLFLSSTQRLADIRIAKTDRRAWVVLHDKGVDQQLPLLELPSRPREKRSRSIVLARRPVDLLPAPIALSDITKASSQLRLNSWRADWWTRPLDPEAAQTLSRLGEGRLERAVTTRLRTSIGRVYLFRGARRPFRDGFQTPYEGNVLFYAQHALALCCRVCVEDWFGIPNGRDLTRAELKFFVELATAFVTHRLRRDMEERRESPS